MAVDDMSVQGAEEAGVAVTVTVEETAAEELA